MRLTSRLASGFLRQAWRASSTSCSSSGHGLSMGVPAEWATRPSSGMPHGQRGDLGQPRGEALQELHAPLSGATRGTTGMAICQGWARRRATTSATMASWSISSGGTTSRMSRHSWVSSRPARTMRGPAVSVSSAVRSSRYQPSSMGSAWFVGLRKERAVAREQHRRRVARRRREHVLLLDEQEDDGGGVVLADAHGPLPTGPARLAAPAA